VQKHGASPPLFEERQGFLIVTFRAQLVAGGAAGAAKGQAVLVSGQPESQPESLDRRVLALLQPQDLGKAEISVHLGQKEVSGQLNKVIRVLMGQGLIEYTLPDKRNSRLQKYRLTLAGERALKERFGEEDR
jgi:ATP-dependent DNA helicase RecG